MKSYKFSIDLFLKDDDNLELGAIEFTRALELPKRLFRQNLDFVSLRYDEFDYEQAYQDCIALNYELQMLGYSHVEFRLRELKSI